MSRYAAAHVFGKTNGPGDARPTALQIVSDEGLIDKLSDKVFVVTGVSSGIGIETARALYATGGHVFATVRNIAKGEKAVSDIKAKTTTSTGKITLIEMDLESLASVRSAAKNILSQTKTINVLINNAGIMAVPEGKTKDGFESQFGVDHLAHFLFFELLKPTLIATSSASFPSRVVSVASFGHRMGPIRFDDFNFDKPGSYDPWVAYGQAKTANIYLANEIERRYGGDEVHPIHAMSLHPGGIATGLQWNVQELMEQAAKDEATIKYMKSTEQGAATSIYAGLSKEWANKGGKYLADCVEQPEVKSDNPMDIGDEGHAAWAYDVDAAKKLWVESLKMVGLPQEE